MTIYLKQFTDLPNAGDVASSVITSRIAEDDVSVIGEAQFDKPNLIAIGSIFHWADPNSVIWGAGLISEGVELCAAPKRILAVRGHLTRERLERQGITCPAVLGDPGIFISEFFPPSCLTVSLGVVPHYIDADEPFVQRAREFGAEILDVLSPLSEYLVNLSSCRKIITSSLHGLIFAHAYGIPAVWVRLSPNVHGDGFKFLDYYSSIGVEAQNVPVFGPMDRLSTIESYCDLPRTPIDKSELRGILLNSLSDLRVPMPAARRW